eukprot:6213435-Pleurochrysis_carterae.AAC.2
MAHTQLEKAADGAALSLQYPPPPPYQLLFHPVPRSLPLSFQHTPRPPRSPAITASPPVATISLDAVHDKDRPAILQLS